LEPSRFGRIERSQKTLENITFFRNALRESGIPYPGRRICNHSYHDGILKADEQRVV
jgi:hypothetical protein